MKQYTVSIPDDKSKLFLDILNELSFIESVEDISSIDISEEQKNIVRERIAKYNDKDYQDWSDLNIDLD